jgi:hypothetical protein
MNKMVMLGKTFLFFGMAASLMGAQSCQQAQTQPERQLRRRVAMGSVTAAQPTMVLPPEAGGGSFDFGFAANAQLQTVLSNTKTFSAVNAFYDPSTVGANDKKAFYECNASNPTKAFEFAYEAACMANEPLAKINATVVDFRFLQGASVDLGFNQLAALKGVSFRFDQAKLTMNFTATNPLLPSSSPTNEFTIASVTAKQYANSVGGKVDLVFSALGVGLGGYYRSDMASVVSQTMEQGFADLKASWDSKDSQYGGAGGWYAMVIKNCDSGILVNAGNTSDAGLMNGDILAIYNVAYQWAGPVCGSQLQFAIQDEKPIAYAKIVTTADTVSRAVIIEGDPAYPHIDGRIVPGSRVYVKKLMPLPATTATKTSTAN